MLRHVKDQTFIQKTTWPKFELTWRSINCFLFNLLIRHYQNTNLWNLWNEIPSVLKSSRATNTIRKYDSYFKRFKEWTSSYRLSSLPSNYETCAVFIIYHLQAGSSYAVIESFIYAIKWYHELYCPNSDPTNHRTITNLLEAFKRLRFHRVKKKEPIAPQHLASIYRLIGGKRASLLLYRDFSMMIVAFSGFLRFDELSHIKWSDISILDSYMSIFLETSKCDQYREGRIYSLSCLYPGNVLVKIKVERNIRRIYVSCSNFS